MNKTIKTTSLAITMFALVGMMGGLGTQVFAIPPPDVLDKLKENLPDPALANAVIFEPTTIEHDGYVAIFQPILTSHFSPNNDITNDETQAKLQIFRADSENPVGCSGTLVDRTHVLSAGHCFSDVNGNLIQDPAQNSIAYFYDDLGNEFIYVITDIVLHPQYDGKGEKGYDLSILTLESEADPSIPTIALDRNPIDDLNNNIRVESFGVGGYGSTGEDRVQFPFGTERRAFTQTDALGDTMYQALGMVAGIDYEPGFVIQTDFDNGGSNTDAFEFFFGITQRGTDNNTDGSACFGDSGGAIFNAQGEATGVNSYITSLSFFGLTTDVTNDLDCSFGEFTGHIRVSQHTNWIDSVIATPEPEPEPEPTLSCGYGTIEDTNLNQCVIDPEFVISCGEGTVLDTNLNQCVVADPKCSPGKQKRGLC
jgi:secreted trypsin-like serine protease